MAEATPRVHARLAGLRGGDAAEPAASINAPAMAPAMAVAAAPAPEMVLPPTPARPRSISSALVPWAGARAAASRAASVAVTHGYDLRSGEASIMRRAPTAVDGHLWRSQELQGPGGRPPADPRWRMWRDASAALVAFALVGLVLLGGDLLRLPSGPPPATPGLVALADSSTPPTPAPVPTADPSVFRGAIRPDDADAWPDRHTGARCRRDAAPHRPDRTPDGAPHQAADANPEAHAASDGVA